MLLRFKNFIRVGSYPRPWNAHKKNPARIGLNGTETVSCNKRKINANSEQPLGTNHLNLIGLHELLNSRKMALAG